MVQGFCCLGVLGSEDYEIESFGDVIAEYIMKCTIIYQKLQKFFTSGSGYQMLRSKSVNIKDQSVCFPTQDDRGGVLTFYMY